MLAAVEVGLVFAVGTALGASWLGWGWAALFGAPFVGSFAALAFAGLVASARWYHGRH